MTACQLLSELRSNNTATRDGSDITLREGQMEGFAGDYINNSQLREIIDNEGGMVKYIIAPLVSIVIRVQCPLP